ncbi:MAG: 50S ribosomal protein L24 [Candidatus Gracilibacteria bacterium]|nr:50S ribosomal protein L24 [Candidatus Gracilibacteria bacterium]
MKLKINDTVQVIAGKNKGAKGKITKIYKDKNKVVVEKVNMRTKHIKKTREKKGEKITFEAPIDASNVMILCPHCNKRVRISSQELKNGKRDRVCRKCKETLTTEVKGSK